VRTPAPETPRDLPAFEAAYRELRAPMVRLAYFAVGSLALAEEIVQDAFLRLHGHFDTVENPGGYVRTTVVRLCVNWSKRHALETRHAAALDEPGPVGQPEIDETWDVLARLSPERRLVLALRYYEDLSNADIARLLGIPVATVRTRIWRALNDLRREIG
jgi:RNA polymerase sigma factor (sigma-70 family)